MLSFDMQINGLIQIKSVKFDNGFNIVMSQIGTLWPWVPSKVACPACGTENIHVHANYVKGGKRYKCLNEACETQTFLAKTPHKPTQNKINYFMRFCYS